MMAPSDRRRAILLKPLAAWVQLFLLGVASLTYALLPGLPFKPAFALVMVVAQAAVILGTLMGLARASAIVRLTALAGVVWLSFLFLMTFADLWTR